jgi:hypothetical protein
MKLDLPDLLRKGRTVKGKELRRDKEDYTPLQDPILFPSEFLIVFHYLLIHFFEIESHYVAQTGLEFSISCLSFPSAGLKVFSTIPG